MGPSKGHPRTGKSFCFAWVCGWARGGCGVFPGVRAAFKGPPAAGGRRSGRALGQALGPGSSKCVSSAAEWLGMLRTAWESVSPLIIKAKRVSGLRYFGGTAAVTLSGPPVSNGRSSWI